VTVLCAASDVTVLCAASDVTVLCAASDVTVFSLMTVRTGPKRVEDYTNV
jgi:hypothetical protein